MVAIPAYSRVRQIRPGAENGMPLKLNDLGGTLGYSGVAPL